MAAEHTTLKRLERLLKKNPKLLNDLLKDPRNPNGVLKKHGEAPLTADGLKAWRATWGKVVRLVIAPGVSTAIGWGGVWGSHWDPDRNFLKKG